MSYDDQVLGVGNSSHPANYTDEQIEEMSELEFAEWERNKYQNEVYFLKQKLENVKTLCNGMSEDNGLAILILKLTK